MSVVVGDDDDFWLPPLSQPLSPSLSPPSSSSSVSRGDPGRERTVPREWTRKGREGSRGGGRKRDSRERTPRLVVFLSCSERGREKRERERKRNLLSFSLYFTSLTGKSKKKHLFSLPLHHLSPPLPSRWLGDEAVGAAAAASAPRRTSAPTKGRAAAMTMPATPSVRLISPLSCFVFF